MTKGQIKVTATTNGKRATLNPIRKRKLRIEAREVESTILCGFRQEWVSGKVASTGATFSLSVGAGCGSPWMTFRYDGREFCVNVEDILNALMDFGDSTKEKPEA